MRFKRIYVEITNMCNLSCSFCPPVRRPNRKMDEAEFSAVINQIKPFTKYIYLHIKGEPLSHPLLPRFLDICDENGIQVNLTTNGTLIDRVGPALLEKPALRQVNFSLHSFDAQGKINMTEYLDNIFSFAKAASCSNGTFIVLRIWNLSQERRPNEMGEVIIEAIRRCFSINTDFETLSHMSRITLDKGVFLSFEQEFVWPSLANPYISDYGICYGARTMAGILADGTVVPCCLDSEGVMNMGNVFNENFGDIIEKPEFDNISKSFSNRKIISELCMRCGYRTRFDESKPVPT